MGDEVVNVAPLGIRTEGERGLLGVAFDPDYATNKWVYLYFTSTQGVIHNRVSRFTVNDANPADTTVVDTPGEPARHDVPGSRPGRRTSTPAASPTSPSTAANSRLGS